MPNLSNEDRKAFEDLTCQLSPENLSCDGMLSRSQTQGKLRRIMIKWAALEQKAGQKVDQFDIECEMVKRCAEQVKEGR